MTHASHDQKMNDSVPFESQSKEVNLSNKKIGDQYYMNVGKRRRRGTKGRADGKKRIKIFGFSKVFVLLQIDG